MLTVMSNKQIDEIKNSISRYLSMREHSKQELTDKLVKKNFNYENIKICINDFCEKDLQSDNRYAESFVRSKYNANKGPNFIIASLRNKGVDMSLINQSISVYNQNDWEKAALLALEKKVISNKNNNNQDIKRKQKLFLERRGFGYKIIEAAIKEYWKL